MADNITTIGTSSRDYATIADWEAAHHLGIGSGSGGAGNHAIGRLYADTEFDITARILMNDATPDAVTLEAASGEEHDGTEDGVGVTVHATLATTKVFDCQAGGATAYTLRGFRVRGTHSGGVLPGTLVYQAFTGTLTVDRMFLVYDYDTSSTGGGNAIEFGGTNAGHVAMNTVCVGWKNNSSVSAIWHNTTVAASVLNCTLMRFNRGIFSSQAGFTVKNTVAFDTATTDFNCVGSGLTANNNASEDATAPGTSAVTGITPASIFTDLTAGTLDLHLVNGSTALDGVGADLGTTPTGIQYDIDGVARSGSWDIGADQYLVSTVTANASSIDVKSASSASVDVIVGAAAASTATKAASSASVSAPWPFSISDARALSRVDVECALSDHLIIYAGTVPANADEALGSQTALVTVDFNATPYNAASMVGNHAVATINTSPSTPSGVVGTGGTATFYRIRDVSNNVLRQGTVSGPGGGGNLVLSNATLVATDVVQIS